MILGVEVAVESGAGEKAGDGDSSLGCLRNGGDLLLEGGLGGECSAEQERGNGKKAHVFTVVATEMKEGVALRLRAECL